MHNPQAPLAGANAPARPPLPVRIAGKPWPIIAILGIVLFLLWVLSTRQQDHHVKAVFPTALAIVPGLDVQANGVDIGKVSSVDYVGGQAVVGLGISDEDAWPLHRGTKLTMRFGTSAGNGTRRIDVVPGDTSAPAIPEGGMIDTQDTSSPVEFDQVFRMMDAQSRDHMQSLSANAAHTLDGRGQKLNAGLQPLAPTFEALGGVFQDLASDQAALRGLISETHGVTRALASRRSQVADLISVASQTFSTFAANTREVGQAIDTAPGTLADTRQTLARLDTSVSGLKETVQDAAPGAARLATFARQAQPAVTELSRTAPRLTALLREGQTAAPRIDKLLTVGTPFAGKIKPIFNDLGPILGCIRPYAPELAAATRNWGAMNSGFDRTGHFIRLKALFSASSNTSTPPIDSATFGKVAGQTYAMPRPPGQNAGQPWFIPECGVGPNALDPTKDPEDKP
jgi:ABC-type transporter Mla subunit MlaD